MIVANKFLHLLRGEKNEMTAMVWTNPKISFLWNTSKLPCQKDPYLRNREHET